METTCCCSCLCELVVCIALYFLCVTFVLTGTCLPVIIQSVSRQTEAVEGARGALTDVLTAVVRLQTQIHTCSTDHVNLRVQNTRQLQVSCRFVIRLTVPKNVLTPPTSYNT